MVMKHATWVIALFGGLVSVGATAADKSVCAKRADEILQALQRGDAAAASAHFDAQVRAGLDGVRLMQVWQQALPGHFGAYQRADPAQVVHQGDLDMAVVPLQFANGPLRMSVACSADGQVTGLHFAPGAAPAALAPSADVQGLPGVQERAITVPAPFGGLPGALMLPSGKGPFPAVVLVAGSGPQDRDETIGPNKPFLDLARGLAAAGIASLRYDKRTVIHGAQLAKTVDDEVTVDALSAIRVLAAQPEINSKQVFLLGHSLGAMMAPRIGQRDPQLAGLILLAAPARSLLDVVAQQAREQGRLVGEPAAKIAASDAAIAAEQKQLAQADPDHPPQGSFGGAPQSYWLSLRDYRQVEVAGQLKMPLLILQGEGDFQVFPHDDFAQWQAAFKGRSHATFHLYPGLGHLFTPVGATGTVADYQAPAHVDARVIADIAAWIHART
jgi:uncharacterized protein